MANQYMLCDCGGKVFIAGMAIGEEVVCPSCQKNVEVTEEALLGEAPVPNFDSPAPQIKTPVPDSQTSPTSAPSPQRATSFSDEISEEEEEYVLHFKADDNVFSVGFLIPAFGSQCVCCNGPASGNKKTINVTGGSGYESMPVDLPVCEACKGHFLSGWDDLIGGVIFLLVIVFLGALYFWSLPTLIVAGILLIPGIFWGVRKSNKSEALRKKGHHLMFHLYGDMAGLHLITNNGRIDRELKRNYRHLLLDSYGKELAKSMGRRMVVVILLLVLATLLILLKSLI